MKFSRRKNFMKLYISSSYTVTTYMHGVSLL